MTFLRESLSPNLPGLLGEMDGHYRNTRKGLPLKGYHQRQRPLPSAATEGEHHRSSSNETNRYRTEQTELGEAGERWFCGMCKAVSLFRRS